MQNPHWNPPLDAAFRHALAWLQALPDRPIVPSVTSEALLGSLQARGLHTLPTTSLAPAQVIEELAEIAEPGLMAMGAGRFFGWVIGGTLPSALAADWLTSAWDQASGSAEATPAAAVIEQLALEWLRDCFALPVGVSGALVTGAQMANFVGLAAARTHVLDAVGYDVVERGLRGAPRFRVLVGAQRHDTIDRALRFLGIGRAELEIVAADERGAIRPDALAACLTQGNDPVIVCLQAGNVNGGAVDPLEAVHDVLDDARQRRPRGAVWSHVDGAFGLWASASPRHRERLAGVSRADSWSSDAHKWLNTPYDCGIAFCAHPASHRRALAISADYLPESEASRVRTPYDFTPELSRRARAFPVWSALRGLGREGVAALVDRCIDGTHTLARGLEARGDVRLLAPPSLNQLVFRVRAVSSSLDVVDEVPETAEVVTAEVETAGGARPNAAGDVRTRAVLAHLQRSGDVYVSGTTWQGRAGIRVSVCNAFTDGADLARFLAAVDEAIAATAG
jgi:glutamate/tyrosine decarboxylase-like PLP-dependent enzyme